MPTERELDMILESELEFKTFKQEPMTNIKKLYEVRVRRVNKENPEYSYASCYTIEANDYHEAQKEARKRFFDDYGAPFDKTEAFTYNKQQ